MDRRLSVAGTPSLRMCRRSIADCLGPALEPISRILTILHARGALEFDLTAPTTSRFAINELEGAIVRRVGNNAAFRPATVLKHIILQLAERTYQAADEPFRQPSCLTAAFSACLAHCSSWAGPHPLH